MSLQSSGVFTTIPDRTTLSDQAIFDQFNRAVCCHDKKKQERLLRRRVLDHLLQVDGALHNKRRRSIRIYIKLRNEQLRSVGSERRCSCILFGEEGYFLQESKKKYGPTLGVRMAVHVVPENTERTVIEDYSESDSDCGETYRWNSEEDQSTSLTSSYHSDSEPAEEELFNQIERNINNGHENNDNYAEIKKEE